MAIKRYYASEDNTITNAFRENLLTRGTGSNMGASDILEAFVIHGQTSASIDAANAEQSRIIIKFPIEDIISDIAAGTIPSSSVDYQLKIYNAPHGSSLPLSYSLDVHTISASWSEGTGLDMENYTDLGASNWVSASAATAWVKQGGDYFTDAANKTSYFFSGGAEDLEVDVSDAITKWRSGENKNYGFLIKNTDAAISGTEGTLFTKKFFSRTSQYFFRRPYIEARWDSARQDDRATAYRSSSLAPAGDNINTVFLYNSIRGQLKDIPNLAGNAQNILVSFYSGSTSGIPVGSKLKVINTNGTVVTNITGGLLIENDTNRTGIYSASFGYTSSYSTLHDVWHSSSVEFFTGSVSTISQYPQTVVHEEEYVTQITNLKPVYIRGQKPILRVYARDKNWQPNVYNVVNTSVSPTIIEEGYYRILRTIDNLEVVPFGTGSTEYTKLSYDMSGNYFELDSTLLESGFSYNVQFLYLINGIYQQQEENFKFRIDESGP
jgi:hypothetical protein